MDKIQNEKKETRILFVCLGNICRSPAAEEILRVKAHELQLQRTVEIDSAGIGAWHIGELPDKRMRTHAARRGYTLSSRARQFSHEDFARFDYIVVMDESNYKDITNQATSEDEVSEVKRMSEFFIRFKGRDYVPDPYYGTDGTFETAIDMIEDGCDGIINNLLK